jgi:hypothetical protein
MVRLAESKGTARQTGTRTVTRQLFGELGGQTKSRPYRPRSKKAERDVERNARIKRNKSVTRRTSITQLTSTVNMKFYTEF